MTKLVKTLQVINWHSITYQELDERFCIIPFCLLILMHVKQKKSAMCVHLSKHSTHVLYIQFILAEK